MRLLSPTDLGLFAAPAPRGHAGAVPLALRPALSEGGEAPAAPLSFVDAPADSGAFPPAKPQGANFWDFLDVINPLQHIPVVSTLYRSVSGDEIGSVPRMMGGALFGGPLGLLSGAINAALVEDTGKDAGALAIALMEGDRVESPPLTDPATPAALDGIATAAGGNSGPLRPMERVDAPIAIAAHTQAQRFRYLTDDRMAGSQYVFETA